MNLGAEDLDSGRFLLTSVSCYRNGVLLSAVLDKKYRRGRGRVNERVGRLYYYHDGDLEEVMCPARGEMVAFVRGEEVFVSSPQDGLWVGRGEEWEKLLDVRTTRVFADLDGRVYVGTVGDYWYLGEPDGKGGWRWHHITLSARRPEKALFTYLLPDPVNPQRLWMGASAVPGFYSLNIRGKGGNSYVATGCWDENGITDLKIKYSFSHNIAFLGGVVPSPCGPYTASALTTQGGRGCVQRTDDGGRTWNRWYDGVFADTVNQLSV